MKEFLKISLISIILFTAAILPDLSAAVFSYKGGYVIFISAVLFIAANLLLPGKRSVLPVKLQIEKSGRELLCAFLIVLLPELVYGIVSANHMNGLFRENFWGMAFIVYLMELVVFWNGIIRVYLTSSMMGTRLRIVGILCGMIPVVNVIVLLKIISVAGSEVRMEEKRCLNDIERKGKNICRTKYPLLMVHGVFFRDLEKFNYWGRIPEELEKNGAVIYYGEQQSSLSIADSGKELAEKIESIVQTTGCGKVNIIAHSKGGLDSRYAISKCGSEKYVASLTTINTPHRGCVFAEWLFDHLPETVRNGIAEKYNSAFRLLGDTTPDFIAAVVDLKASSCEKFNRETPDSKNVYYQSVGSKINKPIKSVFPLNMSYMFARFFDGPNDGLVTVEASKWGDRFIYLESKETDGVSHADVIDLFRHDKKDLDIREFYVGLVSDLKEKGF